MTDYFGVHPIKHGVIGWMEIFDGDVRTTLVEPSHEEIVQAAKNHNLNYMRLLEIINKAPHTTYGYVIEADKFRAEDAGMVDEEDAPPLGLRPKRIVAQLRRKEIDEAIHRYVVAGKDLPLEWLEELVELRKPIDG